jgi:hypothetical protein
MERSRILVLAAITVTGGGFAAQAGPCTTQIAQIEQSIRQAQANAPGIGAGEASAQQTIGAQLHHQPTPGAVAGAERVANADGEAALERARKADAEGNAAACDQALAQAKALYGVK